MSNAVGALEILRPRVIPPCGGRRPRCATVAVIQTHSDDIARLSSPMINPISPRCGGKKAGRAPRYRRASASDDKNRLVPRRARRPPRPHRRIQRGRTTCKPTRHRARCAHGDTLLVSIVPVTGYAPRKNQSLFSTCDLISTRAVRVSSV